MLSRVLIFLLLLLLPAWAQEAPPADDLMTPELLWKLGRLGDGDVSKDGRLVAYTVRSYDLKENKGSTDVFVHDLQTGQRRRLLEAWPAVGDLQFGPSPFGERLYLIGKTGKADKEKPQIFALNPLDGATLQLTAFEDGCSNLKVSPTGSHLAFTLDIKLDKEIVDLYEDLPKADARIIDSLMFRHWNAWHDYKYTHLHVARIGADGKAGKPLDLMEEMKVDCPVPPFGGRGQFDWSPDGKRLAFTMKDVKNWAESTNSDVYLVSLDQPKQHQNISQGNLGYDNDPSFSPDGKYLAWHSMERDGFESDRVRIMVRDLAAGQTVEATRGLDRSLHHSHWLPDSNGFVYDSDDLGTTQVYSLPRQGGQPKKLTDGRYNWSLKTVFKDGSRALVSFSQMERPDELALISLKGTTAAPEALTHINDDIYKKLRLPKVEERWVPASDGKKIHCWVVYPPDFDPAKKYPMLTYCQGGPQAMIGQWFSYRWNFHLMAANGYIVLAPNRRGLPGFGRKWNDDISGDWGGQPMRDLLSATDAMLAEPYVDKEKVGAIGASFGGYTVFWLMGNHQGRFASMIAHCGVFNLEAMYGATEELFFVNWELGGPYWVKPEQYEKFSPHKFVGNWDTPLLVVHGQKDFRIPVTQGMEAFTAAQVKGIPSRFLYYPEEGHWVLGPQNGVLWHRVFFEWLGRTLQGRRE